MNQEIRTSPLAMQIESGIRKQYETGKLKDKHIKDFMKKYYDGDPSSDCPKGCKGSCLLDCYIDIQKALINDRNELIDFNIKYIRDGLPYCCGKQLEDLNNNLYCTACGNEY